MQKRGAAKFDELNEYVAAKQRQDALNEMNARMDVQEAAEPLKQDRPPIKITVKKPIVMPMPMQRKRATTLSGDKLDETLQAEAQHGEVMDEDERLQAAKYKEHVEAVVADTALHLGAVQVSDVHEEAPMVVDLLDDDDVVTGDGNKMVGGQDADALLDTTSDEDL